MRPIDADALPLTDIVIDNGLIPDDDRILELPPTVRAVLLSDLNRAPTIDVQPVVHAHWIRHDGNEKYDECSNCHCAYNSCGWEAYGYYCPHCGAKMDEEVDDQTNTSLPAM